MKFEIITPEPTQDYVFTLTKEEALALWSVTGKITGGGGRYQLDKIFYALDRVFSGKETKPNVTGLLEFRV
jgi:hypothetical protein